jgi:hypothetical protein
MENTLGLKDTSDTLQFGGLGTKCLSQMKELKCEFTYSI